MRKGLGGIHGEEMKCHWVPAFQGNIDEAKAVNVGPCTQDYFLFRNFLKK